MDKMQAPLKSSHSQLRKINPSSASGGTLTSIFRGGAGEQKGNGQDDQEMRFDRAANWSLGQEPGFRFRP